MGGERTEQLSRASISCHALKTQRARRGKGEGREPVAALDRSKPRRGLREIPLKRLRRSRRRKKTFSFLCIVRAGGLPSRPTSVSSPASPLQSNLPTEDEGGGARHPSACLSESPPPPTGSSPFKVRHSAYGGRTTDTEE